MKYAKTGFNCSRVGSVDIDANLLVYSMFFNDVNANGIFLWVMGQNAPLRKISSGDQECFLSLSMKADTLIKCESGYSGYGQMALETLESPRFEVGS